MGAAPRHARSRRFGAGRSKTTSLPARLWRRRQHATSCRFSRPRSAPLSRAANRSTSASSQIDPIRVEAREGVALEYSELLGLASWLPERIKRIVPFCGTVGLRFTEAVTLTDDRVDLEAATIFIPARINKSRRPKPISLARIEVQLLREQLLARPPGHASCSRPRRAAPTQARLPSIWLPALLAAGLAHEETNGCGRTIIVADFRFHWLRHTAISLMARAGMKAELIAERVGHNDGGALIYRRYRHLFPSEVREAVSMLDGMVAETAGNAEAGGSPSGQ